MAKKFAYLLHPYDAMQAHMTGGHLGSLSRVVEVAPEKKEHRKRGKTR